MSQPTGDGNRESRPGPGGGRGRGHGKPRGRRSGHRGGPKPGGSRGPAGLIGLYRLERGDFELVHPRKVEETREDYEEGVELWKEGDPESARDALRYALSACHANLWVHVALGRIALSEFKDPSLARGHFGYAFELVERSLPRDFAGPLPRDRPANRPFYEAIDGLIECLLALGQNRDCAGLRALADRLSRGPAS
jgi:hypothetical protein